MSRDHSQNHYGPNASFDGDWPVRELYEKPKGMNRGN